MQYRTHDFVDAYKCQIVIAQSFLREALKEENWALPVTCGMAVDLQVFDNNADQQLVKKEKKQGWGQVGKSS